MMTNVIGAGGPALIPTDQHPQPLSPEITGPRDPSRLACWSVGSHLVHVLAQVNRVRFWPGAPPIPSAPNALVW